MNIEGRDQSVELAAQLTIAWLSNQNNRVTADDVPAFLRSMYATLNSISRPHDESGSVVAVDDPTDVTPAVSVRKSLASKDHILSLIDGKPYRTLRRHLSAHGLTPEEYRARFNLKADYPMVAESYSEKRRALAQQIGLGQRGRAAKSRASGAPGAVVPTRGRSKKA
jgi:predicted transcriptional regulator